MPADKNKETRGRMSRIDQLPEDIRNLLHRLLREGVPQSVILRRLEAPLAAAGQRALSKSGINRYATRMERMGARIREAREVASVWTAKFGAEPTGEVGQQVVEMLRIMAFDLTLRADQDADGGEPALDADTINALALAVQRLERADAISKRREGEMRSAWAREAEGAAKKVGISGDLAGALREALTRA